MSAPCPPPKDRPALKSPKATSASSSHTTASPGNPRKSLSFSNLLSATPPDFAPPKDKDPNSGHGKFSQFLSSLTKKNKSSTTLTTEGGSDDTKAIRASTDPSTASNKPSSEALQVQIRQPSEFGTFGKAAGDVAPGLWNDSAAFHSAVAAAQDRVNTLNTVSDVLGRLAMGLETAGDAVAWFPGVGVGVKLIATMLESAENVSMGKVAALRLVS